LAVGRLLPVYPDEQAFAVSDAMSQTGHVRTSDASRASDWNDTVQGPSVVSENKQ